MNKVKISNPLVINITNNVTIESVANILTTIGASPIMTNSIEEIGELLLIAKNVRGSLVINIGTLDSVQIELMKEACKIANELDVKIVLDPVGSGASELRTNTARSLLETYKVDVVRGNYSEILSLLDVENNTKGVDSISGNSTAIAIEFSKRYNTTVLISGKQDIIAKGEKYEIINGGSDYLPKISGTGCMLSSIVAAYLACYPSVEACKYALDHVLRASEIAEVNVSSIIEFRIEWFKQMEMMANG